MTQPLRSVLAGALALLGTAGAAAAQVVTVTASNQISALSPINHASSEGAFETVYLQTDINQAGSITRLAFDKWDGTEVVPLTGVVIYLKTTTATGFTTGPLDTLGYQRVYAGPFPNATPRGYQEVVLRTPFAYPNTATQNLAVLVLRKSGNVQATIGPRARYLYGITTNPIRIACRRYTGSDPVTSSTTLTATNISPNIRLTFGTPSATKTGAGAATARLFPLPAAATTTLDARGWAGPLTYFITDALGRVVRPATALPLAADGQYQLALSGLPTGNYHLHLAGAARREVLSLVRE